VHQDTKDLLWYRSETKLGEYIDSQEYTIRSLFRNYNDGDGVDSKHVPVRDMCSGIHAAASAVYTVIHSRYLEGEPGKRLLRKVARTSGCDREAALNMEPEYVKTILEPLGMMRYPIIFISDGQNTAVLERLKADRDLRHLIRTVPEDASWIGGDLTLAVMSNVFIGE